MGLLRKALYVPGVTRFNSKKERTAKATTRSARELRRQTQLMQQAPVQIQPVPTMPPPGYQPVAVAEEFERLASLYQQGVLSAEEFEAAKARLLASIRKGTPGGSTRRSGRSTCR